ncbi:hypothetical protein [Shewanella baltica]|uniref:hypothetical protein n=1 Tax=Shewanella baltica TaxID=62322 RepID=UPI0001DB82BC|nr:hypothetical protein [Shewanella baltica]ADT92955.1 hypothetical protein Sbal678_0771 [Shewanella baltica OS678]
MPSWKQAFKNLDKRLDHEEIDDFLDHLNASLNRRIKRLEDEELSLSPEQFEDPLDIDEYREHLGELAASVYAAKALGDELSIIALYKKVEAHTGRVVKRKVPKAATANLAYFKQLCNVLPFDIQTVDGFAGFNELRLLNNSIKHEGKVSIELAKEFPLWVQGAELPELDKVFQRLLPEIKKYVADLTERLYVVAP